MTDIGKLYYIVDTHGNYYKEMPGQGLTAVRSSAEADTFTFRAANDRIGSGKKSRYYHIIEADIQESMPIEEAPTYAASELESVERPTMFDGLDNRWEEILGTLCYMSSHITDYQANLSQMLSDVDKEICDILHCLEFEDLSDSDMLKVTKMLKERRQRRRQIKDEMDKTEMMRSTFLDKAFGIKVHQGLEQMEHMKERKYTPRKLPELFSAVS